ncbi:MAG: hypothetical protein IM326_05685 [Microcystis sp. M020S1]|nr:hypothetical protein [Microcystis sp. M018S1]MCA2925683.1 hypothetical protein [Microcystis sp. M020S1]MCA2929711.1 hypothetical protein [Microcystis sp. M018S1]MCA2936895.1 hypothetical protein [Microcystis sp. M015S1]
MGSGVWGVGCGVWGVGCGEVRNYELGSGKWGSGEVEHLDEISLSP